jgi:CheY-like chemotaxis protein
MTQPTVRTFRILVVDDEVEVYTVVCENLAKFGTEVSVDFASNADQASERLAARLYDLVLLDLYGKDDLLIGPEVCRRIDGMGLSTRVLLMTRFRLADDAKILLELTNSSSAWRLAGFLDKNDNLGATLELKIGEVVKDFTHRQASVEGLPELAAEIARQRYRYKAAGGRIALRKAREEISSEVDRLLRGLFVDLPGGLRRTSRVAISLAPMERRGLSAAVVVNATVGVDFAALPSPVMGHRTVLKIGPKSDIFDEAARFLEYVRYGVELMQRVELLAVTGADALGGLVYSFAGGTYDHDLISLDEILVEDLRSGDLDASTKVLESLFANKSWYATSCAPMDVGEYFNKNYRTNLKRSCDEGEKQLRELGKTWVDWPKIEKPDGGPRGVGVSLLTPEGDQLPLPDESVLGWGRLAYRSPACLVHGDMHGGNVMLECSPTGSGEGGPPRREYLRTCLIDFRNSGPGPRCTDAVCLESSIRLADAAVINQRIELGSDGPSASLQAEIASDMGRKFSEEKALYRAIFLGDGEVPDSDWARLCASVLEGLRGCFGDVPLREYLATSLRYTLRGLGFRLDPIARLRMTTWLAAQYSVATELNTGEVAQRRRRVDGG